VLRVVRVPLDHTASYAHEVECTPPYSFSFEKKICILTLHDQRGRDGAKVLGKCSKICKHGFLVCTEDFSINFPILIEGGLSDAKDHEEERVKG